MTVEMSKSEIRRYLSRRLIAKLGTVSPQGRPHIVPIWFAYRNGSILLCTSKSTVKVRNIEENPKVCVLVDSAQAGMRVRGAMITGEAEILHGADAKRINRMIHLRYMGSRGLAARSVQDYLSSDDVTIRVNPKRIVSWDLTKSPVSKVKAPPLEF